MLFVVFIIIALLIIGDHYEDDDPGIHGATVGPEIKVR